MPEGISPWAKERSKDVDTGHGECLQDLVAIRDGPMVATIRVRRTWFPSLLF